MQIIPKFRRGAKLPLLKTKLSPNFSSRGGAAIRNIVIHDTEGPYQSAINWFMNKASQVSANLVLREDGKEVTQMVKFGDKAWHCAGFNSQAIGIECAGYAGKLGHDQLLELARIVAFLCKKYRIPVRLVKATGEHLPPGITCHQFLGTYGGGHGDPGWTDQEAHLFVALVKSEYDRGGFRRKWGS